MKLSLEEKLKLYLVIGPADCGEDVEVMLMIIQQAVRGGVRCIQLRDKTNDEVYVKETAQRIIEILKDLEITLEEEILFIINDHVHIATALNVGLHIGQNDMPYEKAREIMGREAIIGLSIENFSQAQAYRDAAYSIPVNYFGVGPIFPAVSHSKPDVSPDIGVEELRKITGCLSHTPCVAIGGIKAYNIYQLQDSGIAGIAVISALTVPENQDTKAAATALCKQLFFVSKPFISTYNETLVPHCTYHCWF